ncbi:MAG: apu 3, partial [Paenibacillus sp.]|nr:apu 3 [Paenibacillus sp.]
MEAMPLQAADQTPPAAPTGLQPTAEAGKVALQWSAVTDADHYLVYVSSNGGSSWDPARNAGVNNQYTVTGLVYGTRYSFAVTAVDASGNESAKSALVEAMPLQAADQTPPAAPTGLQPT